MPVGASRCLVAPLSMWTVCCRCKVRVHQHCYACQDEPEEGWLCDVCDSGEVRAEGGGGGGAGARGGSFVVCGLSFVSWAVDRPNRGTGGGTTGLFSALDSTDIGRFLIRCIHSTCRGLASHVRLDYVFFCFVVVVSTNHKALGRTRVVTRSAVRLGFFLRQLSSCAIASLAQSKSCDVFNPQSTSLLCVCGD